ncbi:MAG: patatin-like phospholipase family protein [Blastocatellia bacterium]
MKFLTAVLALLLLLASPLSAHAVTIDEPVETSSLPPSAPARPRIALVLGGGGARGFAHIGVLKWLEENRIPVDIVVGTSIGGLIGGAYSIGTTPAEMRRLIGDIPWTDVFQQDAPFPESSFRRKEDSRAVQVDFELGLRRGPSLPGGLFPAQPVTLLLNRLSLPYDGMSSFDGFPIPFRAVATDIGNGEQVVISDGSLADAMRATMAVPGVFTPVKRDGRLLVDGGVVNNVPVDVAKAMGADIIIAVDVSTPLDDIDRVQSVLGITNQSLTVMILNNTKRVIALSDVVVVPELGDYGAGSFSSSNEIADLGYKAAADKARFLQTLSVDEATWAAYLAERGTRLRTAVPTPAFVAVTGVDGEAKKEIEERFTEYAGRPLDTNAVELDITKVLGSGRYETVKYGLVERDGKTGLEIRIDEKPYAPPTIRFGVDLSNRQADGADINLNARLTFFDIGGYGTETRIDAGIGTTAFAGVEYYRPLGDSRFFVAPFAGFESTTQDAFRGEDRVARYRVREAGIGFDLGYSFDRHSEARVGYELVAVDASTRIGDPTLPELSGFVNTVRARYTYDGVDNPVIPTRGVRFSGELRRLFDSEATLDDYTTLNMFAAIHHPVRENDTVFLLAAGGSSFGTDVTPPFDFSLGGQLRLSAYNRNEFRGANYFYASPGYLHSLGSLSEVIGGRYYVGAWYEVGSAFNSWNGKDIRHAVAGGFLMNTKIGLITLGGAVGESGRGRIFFSLGNVFR